MDAHRKQRLRTLIDGPRFEGSQQDFAAAVGLTPGRVSQLLGDNEPFGERAAQKICDKLALPSGWFESGKSNARPVDREDFVFVRRADVAFANGVGKVAYHEDEKPPLVFRRDFLRKLGIAEGDAVVVDGIGHSNLPKIPEGAVVLVNRGDRERLDGDFFAFRANGELLIKRLETLKNVGVLATADNPDFKPKTRIYTDGVDDFEVIGRAVWAGAVL